MSADQQSQAIPSEVVSTIHDIVQAFAPEDVQDELDVENAETPQELLTVLLKAGVARVADDVRQRRVEGKTYQQVQEEVEGMSRRKQIEFRDRVWTEFIGNIINAIGKGDSESFKELKKMIRHPYTMEGLLLEFRLDDGEPTDEFIRDVLTFIGMSLFPRMYTDEELERHRDRLKEKFF